MCVHTNKEFTTTELANDNIYMIKLESERGNNEELLETLYEENNPN